MAAQVGDAELSILAPSGAEVAKLSMDAELSAGKIKELLEAQCGYPTNAQQLVCKESPLPDECVLASIWESVPPPYSLVLVLLPFCWWDALGQAAKHGRVAVVRKLMHGYGKIGMMQAGEEEVEEAAKEAACGRGVADALRISIEQHQMAAFTEILVALAEFPAPRQAAALQQAWQPDTLLHLAIKSGHVDMVEKVLAVSMPPGALSMADSNGRPPLHLAALEGSDDVFRALLVALAAKPALLLQRAPAGNSTALHYLMSKGRHAVANEFLEAVDKKDRKALLLARQGKGKWTALHTAMGLGHEEATRALLSAVSADERSKLLFARNKDGCTPMHTAALEGGELVVQRISDVVTAKELHQLLTSHDKKRAIPLHLAAKAGHKALACELLAASSPQQRRQLLAATDYHGFTPVHMAAAEDEPDVLRELLVHATPGAQRALLRAGDLNGGTPLHLASENGHEAAARVLLEVATELGEQLTTQSWRGFLAETPIHLAERDAVAEVILEMRPRLLESPDVRRRGMSVWLQCVRMLCRLQLQGTLAGFCSAAAGKEAFLERCCYFAVDVFRYCFGLGSGPAAAALSLWLTHLGSPVLTAVATWFWVHVATWLLLGAGCLRALLLRRGSAVYSPLPLCTSRHFTRRWFRASFCSAVDHDDDALVWGVVDLHLEELWQTFRLYFPGCKELLRLLSMACCLVSLSLLRGAISIGKIGKWMRQECSRSCTFCIAPFILLVPVAMPPLVSLFFGVSVSLGILLGMLLAAVSPCFGISFLLIETHQLMKDLHACFQQVRQRWQDRWQHRRRSSEEGRQGVTIGRSVDTWKDDEDKEQV